MTYRNIHIRRETDFDCRFSTFFVLSQPEVDYLGNSDVSPVSGSSWLFYMIARVEQQMYDFSSSWIKYTEIQ